MRLRTAGSYSTSVMAVFNGDSADSPTTAYGNLTVNQAVPTINWPTSADIVYGTALSDTQLDATASYDGSTVDGTYQYSSAKGSVLDAGMYQNLSVVFTPTDGIDFTDKSANVTLNVSPAPFTVTADAQTMAYGTSVPNLAYDVSGFVNGDTSAAFVGVLATAAMSSSSVGGYGITQRTLAATGNYTIGQFDGGTLTVTPAILTITAANQIKTYGFGGTSAALGTSAFTESGLLGSDSISGVTLSTNATTSTSGDYNAGTWTITPSAASGSGLSNYTIAYANASVGLTVAQKALSITGLSGTNKVYDSTTSDPPQLEAAGKPVAATDCQIHRPWIVGKRCRACIIDSETN